jgi:hypothetical protein
MKTNLSLILLSIIILGCSPKLNHPLNVANSPTISSQFNGWTLVKALGAKTVKQTPQALTPEPAVIALSWNPYLLNINGINVQPNSYIVYRSLIKGGTSNKSTSISTTINGTTTSFTESQSLMENTFYYYRVNPVFSGNELMAQDSDAEVEIFTPSKNMALVHRWIANQDMCKLLGQSSQVDRNNNYRCPYSGPGNLNYTGDQTGSGFFDFGSSYLIDSYEAGCNYSLTACSASSCLGITAPTSTIGSVGSVYFNRGDSRCYFKRDSVTWVEAEVALPSELALMTTNVAGNPAMAMIGQDAAALACQTQNSPNLSGNKYLVSRKLFLAAAAWDDSVNVNSVPGMELGQNLNTGNGFCNSDQGNGLNWTAETGAIPNDYELITGLPAANSWAVRTGSNATKNCVSKYGIQDLIGNVWEINSDDVQSNTDGTGMGIASLSDPNNFDFKDVALSYQSLIGDLGGANGNAGYLKLSQMFLPALGIPLPNGSPSWYSAMTLGMGVGQFDPSILNDDYAIEWLISASTRSVGSGGSFAENFIAGSPTGRFAFLTSVLVNGEGSNVGFRCSIPVTSN